jgi:hypothetical protein
MPEPITDDAIVSKLMRGYEAALKFHEDRWAKRREYNNIHEGTQSAQEYEVPYAATLVDTVWPLLTAKMPFAEVDIRNPEEDARAAKLGNELVDYAYDMNNFEDVFLGWQHESMVKDTSWLQVTWPLLDNEADHPKIELLDTMSVYPHPFKKTIDDKWPVYVVSEMTKSQMKEMGWDEKEIKNLGDSTLKDSSYRKMQIQEAGYDVNTTNEDWEKTDTLYEVIQIWGRMNIKFDDDPMADQEMAYIVIANRKQIVNKPVLGKQRFQSPYNHKYIPLVPLSYLKKAGSLLGKSLISLIWSQQKELDRLENEKVKNYRRRNNPVLRIRRSGNIKLRSLRMVNNAPWMVNEPGDITPLELPDIASSIDAQQDRVRMTMQNRVGANDVLLVSDYADMKGGDTYGGAAIANENTKLRFRPQATYMDGAIKRLGQLIIELYQDERLFTQEKSVRIAGEDGEATELAIDNSQIKNVKLRYHISAHSTLAESKVARFEKISNIKAMYAENPDIKQDVLDRWLFEAAELDYEALRMTKDDEIANLAAKLQELVAMAKRPEFKNMPAQKQNAIMVQIQQMRDMLIQLTGGEGAAGAAPAGVVTPGAVPAATPAAMGEAPQPNAQ